MPELIRIYPLAAPTETANHALSKREWKLMAALALITSFNVMILSGAATFALLAALR